MFEQDKKQKTITVLGKTFNSEEERIAFFRDELRKKLPELKQMEGFPVGEDEDIINLSDPPYYTACPNPWLGDFISEWEEDKKHLEKEGRLITNNGVDEPYANDISVGKNNPIYRAHSYHTKVPHPAIMKYLHHYTNKGDIVLDGFQGTGMTGVAAKSLNHKADKKLKFIGIDLSPIAGFISYNFNKNWDLVKIRNIFNSVLKETSLKYGWLYETFDSSTNTKGKINYVIWSDSFICPNCDHSNTYWSYAFDIETEQVNSPFNCPNCFSVLEKKDLKPNLYTEFDVYLERTIKQIKKVPVLIDYTNSKGKRLRKSPDKNDFETLEKIRNSFSNLDYRTAEICFNGDHWGDTWRKGSHTGITHSHHFYENRTLVALSRLLEKFKEYDEFPQLLFFLTSIVGMRCTRRMPYRSGGKSAGSVNNMTLPSISQEYNVFDTIKRKYRDIEKAKLELGNSPDSFSVSTQSATELPLLSNNCVDYIFLDPPFGSNIMYSEMSFMSESWLAVYTNNEKEAIESKSQNKGNFEYQELISNSFNQFYRILKPGKWMTIEFSNTSAAIWNIIQNSIQNVGFVIANVSGFDKKQGSFNAVNTATAVKQDLVISCYKPSSEFDSKFKQHRNDDVAIWSFIQEHLNHLPIHQVKENSTTAIIERSPKILFDRLIAFYVQKGLPVPIDAGKFQEGLREGFAERDGMFFSDEQVHVYDKKKEEHPNLIQYSLFISSEQDGVLWLKNYLIKKSATYQDIRPDWMQALGGVRKGDIIPEMETILEENFLKNDSGKWYLPDPENEADLDRLRNKRLLKKFEDYKNQTKVTRAKSIKEVRVDALRAGFKQCYQEKDFTTIVAVGDKIPNNLLMEDEVLLQFYDIASSRV